MTLLRVPLLIVAAAVALAACSPATDTTPEVLRAEGYSAADPTALVDALDRLPVTERSDAFLASVRYDEVLISEPGSEQTESVPLDDDQFYLSIAPYVSTTHECHFHSLTTCQGELAGVEVAVTITDLDTGEVVVDAVETTYDNGFVAFWVPRDMRALLEVDYDGKTASSEITTGPEDATCITTLQLI